MKNKALCVLVPDVHGRKFWKDIEKFDCEVIFLGDYLDPYEFEGITPEDALENFKEILDYAKSHSNVKLLLGNHDCEYAIGTHVCNCRCDYDNFHTIRNLFLENKNMFFFATKREFNGRPTILSHAGIHPSWLKRYSNVLTIDIVCNVNYGEETETYSDYDKFTDSLCDVSYLRGGWNPAGSVIWSDIREYRSKDIDWDVVPYDQICGHTYLQSIALHTGRITCIDLQQIFVVNQDGVLCDKNLEPIEIIEI